MSYLSDLLCPNPDLALRVAPQSIVKVIQLVGGFVNFGCEPRLSSIRCAELPAMKVAEGFALNDKFEAVGGVRTFPPASQTYLDPRHLSLF